MSEANSESIHHRNPIAHVTHSQIPFVAIAISKSKDIFIYFEHLKEKDNTSFSDKLAISLYFPENLVVVSQIKRKIHSHWQHYLDNPE